MIPDLGVVAQVLARTLRVGFRWVGFDHQYCIIPQTDLSVGVLAVLIEGRWSLLATVKQVPSLSCCKYAVKVDVTFKN